MELEFGLTWNGREIGRLSFEVVNEALGTGRVTAIETGLDAELRSTLRSLLGPGNPTGLRVRSLEVDELGRDVVGVLAALQEAARLEPRLGYSIPDGVRNVGTFWRQPGVVA